MFKNKLTHNLIENESLSTSRFEVLEDRIESDVALDPVVMHISDLHFRFKKRYYGEVTNIINRVKPDLLLITGDVLECTKNFGLLRAFLDTIDPSIRMYVILGNHEDRSDIDYKDLKALYESYNCRFLRGEGEKIIVHGVSFNIYGADYLTKFTADLSEFKPEKDAVNLVLIHCPGIFDTICRDYPDDTIYVFAGHSHGGAVTFFGHPIVIPTGSGRYLRGKHVNGNKTLYVSKGIGSGGILDVRFYAKRDMIVLKFSQEK